jgi:hypothetical protein
MKIILKIFIFCIILFIYLHIQFHLKTSNELEILEIEQPSKEKFEEICDIRQPTIFYFNSQNLVNETNIAFILDKYYAFDMKIRNINDIHKKEDEIFMPLPLHSLHKLLSDDNSASYFSENNSDFLKETGIIKSFKYNDTFFRPHMVSNCYYDIIRGSQNSYTPFRFEINYRNFIMPTDGNIRIKLAPPKSKKYLFTDYNYETFEFSSPINPWDVQPQYAAEFDKVRCLEFELNVGSTLFIPPYWWYSIKFSNKASVSVMKYRTYMNNLTISPYLFMFALQLQNIQRKSNNIKNITQNNEPNIKQNNEPKITQNNEPNITQNNEPNITQNNEPKIEETYDAQLDVQPYE